MKSLKKNYFTRHLNFASKLECRLLSVFVVTFSHQKKINKKVLGENGIKYN